MHATTALLALAATALAQTPPFPPAPVVSNNPLGATYVATLPNTPKTAVRGSIQAATAPGGVGVSFTVSFTGLPASGGPFLYHVHEKPVPADGNCTATLAHLDPYARGEAPVCDIAAPATCQVGDLSGKHGSVPGPSYTASYSDRYVSSTPGTVAYFGDKSFVVHFANKTRITCANFVQTGSGVANGTGGASPTGGAPAPTGTGYTPPSPSGTIVTGAGAVAGGSVAAGLVGLAALLL